MKTDLLKKGLLAVVLWAGVCLPVSGDIVLIGDEGPTPESYKHVGWNWDGGFAGGAGLARSEGGPLGAEHYLVCSVFANHYMGIFDKDVDANLMENQNGVLSLWIKVLIPERTARKFHFAFHETEQAYTSFELDLQLIDPVAGFKDWRNLKIPFKDGAFKAEGATLDQMPVEIKVETSEQYTGSMVSWLRWKIDKEQNGADFSIGLSGVNISK